MTRMCRPAWQPVYPTTFGAVITCEPYIVPLTLNPPVRVRALARVWSWIMVCAEACASASE